jgi:hypothetical protein
MRYVPPIKAVIRAVTMIRASVVFFTVILPIDRATRACRR